MERLRIIYSNGHTIKETDSGLELGQCGTTIFLQKRIRGKNRRQFRYTKQLKALLKNFFFQATENFLYKDGKRTQKKWTRILSNILGLKTQQIKIHRHWKM